MYIKFHLIIFNYYSPFACCIILIKVIQKEDRVMNIILLRTLFTYYDQRWKIYHKQLRKAVSYYAQKRCRTTFLLDMVLQAQLSAGS